MIKKLQNFVAKQGIETIAESTRGGMTYSPSGSAAGTGERTARSGRVDTKWIALSGAFTSSNLSQFTETGGKLTYTGGATKTFYAQGLLSLQGNADVYLNLAIAKNGAVLSASHSTCYVSSSYPTAGPTLNQTPVYNMYSATRVELAKNDYLELHYSCLANFAVVTASSAQLSVYQ